MRQLLINYLDGQDELIVNITGYMNKDGILSVYRRHGSAYDVSSFIEDLGHFPITNIRKFRMIVVEE